MQLTIGRVRKSRRFHELLGLLLVVVGLVSLLALVSYDATDESWFHRPDPRGATENWIGKIGATWAESLLQLLGTAALLFPVPLFVLGWGRLRRESGRESGKWLAGSLALGFALCALLDLLYGEIAYGGEAFHAGGLLGFKLAAVLRGLLNTVGALLFTVTLVVGLVIVMTRISLVRTLALAVERLHVFARVLRQRWAEWRVTWSERREEARARVASSAAPPAAPAPNGGAVAPQRRPSISVGDSAAAGSASLAPPPPVKPRPPAPKQVRLPMESGKKGYSLPPIELLNDAEAQVRESENELLDRAKKITEKFREFAIDGLVVAIHPGPVVTTFEFKPEPGVKYSKITGMTDDLSLALKAESVRIDRLAGRSTIGIEVPNRRQETIFPRELIASARFRDSESKLTLALGKDIHGEVCTADLDTMPHLLIAGATGAGKSVGLNGMIVSMLYKATPHDLRLIMIDTKMIELGIYSDIPHLLIPVVTEPKHASAALKWAVREMEIRYHKLAAVGVRNIAQFNDLLVKEPERTMDDPKGGDPIRLTHMPYIVVVIDEMADLMMVSSADVEESVMRLAQMARAVGIHLILATQRPSVDVITGTIKANFPSRIAFRVSQRVDSRTIIDQQGAEHLLGRGDMLFLPTGSSRVKRLHSGYITEAEINRITSFLCKMAEPVYDDSVLKGAEESSGVFDGGERDEMFVEAVRTVVNEGKCSITLIQRRLQLGYARAARIVDMMEHEGIVSPGEGSKPREVLVGAEALAELEAQP